MDRDYLLKKIKKYYKDSDIFYIDFYIRKKFEKKKEMLPFCKLDFKESKTFKRVSFIDSRNNVFSQHFIKEFYILNYDQNIYKTNLLKGTNIYKLYLTNCRIKINYWFYFCEALKKRNKLEELKLSNVEIFNNTTTKFNNNLFESLKYNKNLKLLSFENMKINNINFLCDIMKNNDNKTLKTLEFDNCLMEESDIERLLISLKENKTLNKLRLIIKNDTYSKSYKSNYTEPSYLLLLSNIVKDSNIEIIDFHRKFIRIDSYEKLVNYFEILYCGKSLKELYLSSILQDELVISREIPSVFEKFKNYKSKITKTDLFKSSPLSLLQFTSINVTSLSLNSSEDISNYCLLLSNLKNINTLELNLSPFNLTLENFWESKKLSYCIENLKNLKTFSIQYDFPSTGPPTGSGFDDLQVLVFKESISIAIQNNHSIEKLTIHEIPTTLYNYFLNESCSIKNLIIKNESCYPINISFLEKNTSITKFDLKYIDNMKQMEILFKKNTCIRHLKTSVKHLYWSEIPDLFEFLKKNKSLQSIIIDGSFNNSKNLPSLDFFIHNNTLEFIQLSGETIDSLTKYHSYIVNVINSYSISLKYYNLYSKDGIVYENLYKNVFNIEYNRKINEISFYLQLKNIKKNRKFYSKFYKFPNFIKKKVRIYLNFFFIFLNY